MSKKSRVWSPYQSRYIFNRDGLICIYCGNNYATDIDHVIPFDFGGPTDTSNGVASCHGCNIAKAHHLEEYLTKGIFWLMTHGEDTSWMDKIDMKRIEHSKSILGGNVSLIYGSHDRQQESGLSPRKYIPIEYGDFKEDYFKEYNLDTVELIEAVHKENKKIITEHKSLSDKLDEILAILNRNKK
jgi:hypothetical protein